MLKIHSSEGKTLLKKHDISLLHIRIPQLKQMKIYSIQWPRVYSSFTICGCSCLIWFDAGEVFYAGEIIKYPFRRKTRVWFCIWFISSRLQCNTLESTWINIHHLLPETTLNNHFNPPKKEEKNKRGNII